jgi:hypothetical protein
MSEVITAVLSMIQQLLPLISNSGTEQTIAAILQALTGMVPFIIQEIQALYTPVKNIIAALSANPAATADQLAALQALDQQVDAAFEQAAADTDAGVTGGSTGT